jgi:hypothetical protein
MNDKTVEPAALAGIEPVAQIVTASKTIPYPHIERLVDVGTLPTGSYLYSAAAVERLVQERDQWKQLAANCELVEEQVSSSYQLAASQAREQQLRAALGEIAWSNDMTWKNDRANAALHAPQDDTALRQWGAKLLRNMADECHYDRDGEMLRRKADELENKK